jgi:hypothetical protein
MMITLLVQTLQRNRYKGGVYQVNYEKLLEMNLFFLCHNIWGVAKLEDLGNKKSQTVGVALKLN